MKYQIVLISMLYASCLTAGGCMSTRRAESGILIEAYLYKRHNNAHRSMEDQEESYDLDYYFPDADGYYSRSTTTIKPDSFRNENRITLGCAIVTRNSQNVLVANIPYYVRIGKGTIPHTRSTILTLGNHSVPEEVGDTRFYAIIAATKITRKKMERNQHTDRHQNTDCDQTSD